MLHASYIQREAQSPLRKHITLVARFPSHREPQNNIGLYTIRLDSRIR